MFRLPPRIPARVATLSGRFAVPARRGPGRLRQRRRRTRHGHERPQANRSGRGPGRRQREHASGRLAYDQPGSCSDAAIRRWRRSTATTLPCSPKHGLTRWPPVRTAVPLAVDGVIYVPSGGQVVALDAGTGEELWTYTLPADTPSFRGLPAAVSNRGVAWWPGDADAPARILFMNRSQLIAVDAATGEPVDGFGDDGHVDVGVPYGGTPTVWRDVAIIGAAVLELPQGPPATRGRSMSAPAANSGSSRPCRARASRGTKPGATDGRTVPAPTCGPFPQRSTPSAASLTCRSPVPRQLLRRRPPRRQHIRQLHRRRGRPDGQVPLAFPDRSPRPVGLRHAHGGRARGSATGRWRVGAIDRSRGQTKLRLRPRPGHGPSRCSKWRSGPFRRATSPASGTRQRSRSRSDRGH